MQELTRAFEAKQLKDKQAFLEAMKILNQLELNGKLIVEPKTIEPNTLEPNTLEDTTIKHETIKPTSNVKPIISKVINDKPIRQDIIRNNNINLGEGLEYSKKDKLEVINTGPNNLIAARKLFKENKYIKMVKTEVLIEFFELLRELTDMAIDDGHDKPTVDYLIEIIDSQLNMFREKNNDGEDTVSKITKTENNNTSLFDNDDIELYDEENIKTTTVKKSFSKEIGGRINVDESK